MKINTTTAGVVAVGLAVGVGAGVASATIPDSSGVIHACYLDKIGCRPTQRVVRRRTGR